MTPDTLDVRHVSARLDLLRARLAHPDDPPTSTPDPAPEDDRESALDALVRTAGLSSFERDVLLLAASVELDSRFAPLFAGIHDDPDMRWPTFGLAFRVLAEPHWDAVTPHAPLRRLGLIDEPTGAVLTSSRLSVPERVWQHLIGIGGPDPALGPYTRGPWGPASLVPSHWEAAERAARTLAEADGTLPILQLHGSAVEDQILVARGACELLGLEARVFPADLLPSEPHRLAELVKRWRRETVLEPLAMVVDCHGLDASVPGADATLRRLLASHPGVLLLCTAERRATAQRATALVAVDRPLRSEQVALWAEALRHADPALEATGVEACAQRLASQFSLSPPQIAGAATQARGHLAGDSPGDAGAVLRAFWDATKAQVRPKLDALTRFVHCRAGWGDLVLPERTLALLHHIEAHVRHKVLVHEEWGFSAASDRGRGTSVLLAGPSGTGKTLTAEVLAGALALDLYRVDLSAVVSKYIGETESNLARVFDAAECGGIALLFDEADALFGKRSDVKDANDRHANLEVSYLLQRMEAFGGLAILTTNLKDALDHAFLRRFDFVVDFPFPRASEREALWRGAFPAHAPVDGVDPVRLAQLNVSGGSIRNIALNAAFRAADERPPIAMRHLIDAARLEYDKLQQAFTSGVLGDPE